MERARVTVGIPFFNVRHTLADAVRSVFAQTYTDWEIILVDDGSTDGSADLAGQIHDSRVRLIVDGSRKGVAVRRNQIVDLTRTELLAWLDADDLMHPDRLARQVAYFDGQPATDALGTAAYTIDSANRILGIRGDGPLVVDAARILGHGLFLNPTVMGRTAWFRQHRYDAAFHRSEDRDLWVRSCRSSCFGKIPEPLLFYREGQTINLANYVEGNGILSRIVRRSGPSLVGTSRSRLLQWQLALKNGLYRSATALGLQACL
ncbi:MAG TPA: glycosyltransferase family 2 protein, partial [Gemmataceae bacterium]|nr:glycosyltransferase family 2 protein [Gemmataceae bacterium]